MTTTDTPAEAGTSPAAATAPAAPLITMRLFAGAAAEYGADVASVHGTTLREALDALLVGASAEAARVIERSSFLVNALACTDPERALEEGDRVDVLPPFAGG